MSLYTIFFEYLRNVYSRYLPVLKNFPTRYIHEPWNAPLSVQRAAKCIIGQEYALPMVNHSKSSRINVERMKQVYQQFSKYRANGMCKLSGHRSLWKILMPSRYICYALQCLPLVLEPVLSLKVRFFFNAHDTSFNLLENIERYREL